MLPAVSLNLTTVINFQPVGRGRAAINGDFILIAPRFRRSSGQCVPATSRSWNCTTMG